MHGPASHVHCMQEWALFKKMGLSWPLSLYFCLFSIIQLTDKFLPILGFKLRISGVGSDCSANCATTTFTNELSLFSSTRWSQATKQCSRFFYRVQKYDMFLFTPDWAYLSLSQLQARQFVPSFLKHWLQIISKLLYHAVCRQEKWYSRSVSHSPNL